MESVNVMSVEQLANYATKFS